MSNFAILNIRFAVLEKLKLEVPTDYEYPVKMSSPDCTPTPIGYIDIYCHR